MLESRITATLGTLLSLSSILLGPQFWGYQTGVLMLQAGVLALGLGLFLKINPPSTASDSILFLDDIETMP